MTLRVDLCFQNPETLGLEKSSYAWEPGMTVAKLLELSGVLLRFPSLKNRPMGVFSEKVDLDTPLSAGDRLEIYAPLQIDPKEARRLRAKKR